MNTIKDDSEEKKGKNVVNNITLDSTPTRWKFKVLSLPKVTHQF